MNGGGRRYGNGNWSGKEGVLAKQGWGGMMIARKDEG